MNAQKMRTIISSNKKEPLLYHENAIGLSLYRRNPFRVLRIPISTNSKKILWQAEKILSLNRLNLPPKEPDPIPWLPGNDEMEIKQAAKKLEEPLQRLIEHLFWFDFERDPRGALLCEGLLQLNSQKLLNYLQTKDQEFTLESLPDFKEKEPSPQEDEDSTDNEKITSKSGDYAVITERIELEKRVTVFSHCINRANLQLLLALSLLHGIGPQMNGRKSSDKHENNNLSAFSWKKDKKTNPSFIINPHDLLFRDKYSSLKVSGWDTLWIDALSEWSNIITNPHFLSFLESLKEGLGEELIDEGVIETIINAIPTRLADILVGEIKVAINENTNDMVTSLVDIAASAPIDQKVWSASFNSLHYFFQSELSELTGLIENETTVTQEDIQHYFKRISQVKERFDMLDPENVLGLSKLIDEAVMKGFYAVTSLDYSGGHIEKMKYLLWGASVIVHSNSFREQINTYISRNIQLFQSSTCNFCGEHKFCPNYPIILYGKKEIMMSFDTTYPELKAFIVSRCENCADFQQFIINISSKSGLFLLLGSMISIFGIEKIFKLLADRWEIEDNFFAFGIILAFFLFLGWVAYRFLAFITDPIFRRVFSFILVPEGQEPYYKVKKTKAYQELLAKGYSLDGVDLSKDAFENIFKQSKEKA